MEKVSIIIPVYNSEKSLQKCLTSVCEQTYKNIEIIVLNDGSKDQSQEICSYFAEKDERIIFVNKENSGPSHTRNVGITKSNGKYLMFVDADDYLDKDYVEEMVSCIGTSQADIVVSGFTKEEKEVSTRVYLPNKIYKDVAEATYELFRLNLFGYTCNKLIKRDIVETNNIFFDTNLNLFEDQYFYCAYFRNIATIHVSDNCGYHYCIQQNSLTTSYCENRFYLCNEMMLFLNSFFEDIKMLKEQAASLLYNYSYLTLHVCISQLVSAQSFKHSLCSIQQWEKEYLVQYFIENYKRQYNKKVKSKLVYTLITSNSKFPIVSFYYFIKFIRRL